MADPPIDLALSVNGDLTVDTDLAFTSGQAAVAQAIRIRLQTFVGEWFLDLNLGVDYYGKILGQKFDAAVVREEIRKNLISAPGVVALNFLNVTFDGFTRTATASWEVVSNFGTIADTLKLGG